MTFLSGLANCHLPGLYSLVLRERMSDSEGMRRIFYCGPECNMDLWDGGDFRLKPHNHRQSIRLTLLAGEVTNILVKPRRHQPGMRVWRYALKSALLSGQFELQRMWTEDIELQPAPLTAEGLRLHWSEFHTVVAKPKSAWLVEELELAPEDVQRCLSLSVDLALNSHGLYTPLHPSVLDRIAEHFRSMGIPEQ